MRTFIYFALFFISSGIASAQNFNFQMIGDTVSYGQPAGNDIVVKGNIVNTGTTNLEIRMVRKQNNLPSGWASYMCSDICLAPFVDSSEVWVNAGQTQEFKLSFTTTNVLDTANCLIVFRNLSNLSNTTSKRMWAITSITAGMKTLEQQLKNITIGPNPCKEKLLVPALDEFQFTCLDMSGRSVKVNAVKNQNFYELDLAGLSAGMYLLQIENSSAKISRKFIKE